ncbi:MAG TPA: hypothetical protein VF795_05860 [Desulfuromonadaceae bacterium]
MTRSILFQRRHVWLSGSVSLVFTALLALAGCGGVGTGGTGSFTALSGYAADGYLVKATVFMDKNGNYQLDPGEPSATTDANGAYTLNVDPADVGRYPIVVLATKGVTIDRDTGTAVTSSYLFSMPAAAVSGTPGSNFVSPMSSMVRELMETGKYATMQQAMDAMNAQMGLAAGTNIMVDYLATSNTALHTAAQNMATLMASQMTQIFSADGTVDVNRYRAMMGTIFTDMPSMMGSTSQGTMASLIGTMTTTVSGIPSTSTGQPFKNMSAAFRGGMM